MYENKDIKNLLREYALHETSPHFNNSVMQRISPVVSVQNKHLINVHVLNLLKIVFLVCVLALIACFIFLPFGDIDFVSVDFNKDYRPVFSFLVVFWVIMFINTWWNKSKETIVDIEGLI